MQAITPEQQEIARQTRLRKIAYAELNLRCSFADEHHWRELASKHGLILPRWYHPGTDLRHLRRAMRKLGVSPQDMRDYTGFSSVAAFANANHTWPAFALVGLLLEHVT